MRISSRALSLADIRGWARRLKRDILALYVAARDRRTPWAARTLALVVAAYAFSPVDLIPDFIPILGLLDDLVLLPLGIWLVLKLIPPALMDDYRAQADGMAARPRSMGGLLLVVISWLAMVILGVVWLVGAPDT